MCSENSAGLSASLEDNINLIKSTFIDDDTLILRYVENRQNRNIRFCLFYTDGMVNNKLLDDDMIKPIEEYVFSVMQSSVIDTVAKSVTHSNSVVKTADYNQLVDSIVYGDTVLIADGEKEALILNTKGWSTRSIIEPESEKVMRGPREGFVESIITNITLVRRRIRNPDLKFKYMTFGTRTKTKGCICYIDSLVNKNVLNELKKRLESFSIDGTLDVNYIQEFISDAPYSPIKTIGSTERPDSVAAKLLEGRVALFLDGTPMVLTCPYLFIENFQSEDDYYLNYFYASIGRILRILAFFISTTTPALYVAVTTFHQEFLPTNMLLSISLARQGVPFPTVVEAILMLLVFEILREAGTRMPQTIGQTLSIVGVLVIGQAAVDARIVSAPMIIVVAITGITGLMISRIKGMIIILRFILLGAASIIGLYGLMFGMLGFLIYVYNLNSFGIPIVSGNGLGDPQKNKDLLVRAPWWLMKKRPHYLTSDLKRQSRR